MSGTYKIDMYHPVSGQRVAEISDMAYLAVNRFVNEPGAITFGLSGDHAALPIIAAHDDLDIVAQRRDDAAGLPWTPLLGGRLVRDETAYEHGDRTDIIAMGDLARLGQGEILYYPGTAGANVFVNVPGETAIKQIIRRNLGDLATTANGRLKPGTRAWLQIEADGGRGAIVSERVAWQGVLQAVQKLARQAGGDIDLVKVQQKPPRWEFRFYPGQRGQDRRSDVVFELARGNMAKPRIVRDRSRRATAIMVGGRGEEKDRDLVLRYAANWSANDDHELFYGATDVDQGELDILAARGDAELRQRAGAPQLTFQPLQTPDYRYMQHYNLGDLVRGRYRTLVTTHKVVADTFEITQGQAERIDVEVRQQ